jgi:hypothetical protein
MKDETVEEDRERNKEDRKEWPRLKRHQRISILPVGYLVF